MPSTTFVASGLTCNNCVAHLTEELMGIDAVTDVAIDLVPGEDSTVVVQSERPLTAEEISHAADEAGYPVTL